MKRSASLLKQHIGWHFEKHWRIQGRRKPIETGAEKVLKQKGITVYKPDDILKEKPVFERVDILKYKEEPIPLDQNHPNWHDRILFTYKDNNVLLEGLTQAKIITKTVELRDGLPQSMIALKTMPEGTDRLVKNIILSSKVFDAEQKKLPKIKDPERPAWNFPRVYGITQNRVVKLLISKLLQLIESTSKQELVKERYLFNDLLYSFSFEKSEDLLQFQLNGDFVITSTKPLSSITLESTESLELPDIFPIKPTITLNEEKIYEILTAYPIKPTVSKYHPHTIFINYNKEEVKNLFEEEVTDTQIFGRSLLKAFTVAASYARQKYGEDVKILPHPVTLQSIQTDGRFFHFGVFQLNTLDLEGGGMKNVWYQTPMLYLYENCCYKGGRPVLEGYNNEVVKQLYAFYNNV